jgi:uncharacterized protein YabN with tetrapyrrole methylase and pyrophosphatase domain
MAGHLDEAGVCLCQIMAGHGQIAHRPAQLLQMAGNASAETLADMLVLADRGYLDLVIEALRLLPAPGPQTADAVDVRRASSPSGLPRQREVAADLFADIVADVC